ncbi:ATP-binding protein [Paenibacillus sp. 7541]|uniref:hybrid sensor histidine kinase/response regulator n=1 Tax=Paenibacillus sp. 7541 TaxID=2026236 RepID=UPI001595350E|nr:ATP-binding protein [Paenibacillus sp. 7541]
MMKRRKIAALIGLFLLMLTVVRLTWINIQTTSTQVHAESGVLDLRDWAPADRPILTLVGEWEFYPMQLITPTPDGSFAVGDHSVALATIPGSWQREMPSGSVFGHGTYRLRVVMPSEGLPELKIRVPGISASSALYVNGQLMEQSGQPAEHSDSYTASNVPYSIMLPEQEGTLDIVLQTANYNDRVMGGLTEPIKLGTNDAMNRAYWFSAGAQATVFLLVLMHAIYALVLYFIGAREKPLLIFSLLSISGAATVAVDIDRLLPAWFGVDYVTSHKIYYLSYLGVAALVLPFIRGLLPESPIMRHSRWHLIVCIVFGVLVLALPVELYTYADVLHTLLMVISFVITPFILYLAVRRGLPDTIYLLLGSVALVSNLVWGILNYSLLLDIGYYPFDMLAVFISFALFWFKRYFRNASEMARLAEKLQRADKLKDEFLVHTSHELRNPLHAIMNMAQTVMDSGGRAEDRKNHFRLKLLVSVGKRMNILLSDLIDLTRLRENRIRIEPAPVLLQAEAAGVLDMVRFLTEGKPIRFENRIPESLPPVLADENRLLQIMFNLLHNAVKFTREGVVAIEAEVQGSDVVVRVTDTGVGMDEETLSRIFEPYEQAEEHGRSASGFGLGLTISKQLVELHGGELTATSTPNAGSVFSFTLPVAPAEAEVAEAPGADTPVSAVRMDEGDLLSQVQTEGTPEKAGAEAPERPRILAVDDDPVNLYVLRSALAPDAYEIVTATSGAKALSLLNQETWDLIITDVMMPEMSGYEVTRSVRTLFSHSELPILLLTARHRPEDIEAGFRAGANDYIVKPVDAQELRVRVQALTAVARAAREQTRLEAAWLQAQIQPHFLFNTLNSVAALAEVDTERMQRLLLAFGDYLRSSFDFTNLNRLVPLRKELGLVQSYLYIEKERFGDRIQIEWEVNQHLELNVPPLSVQPLVENALRHGLLQRSRGGTVRIRVIDRGDRAEISVEDNGVGIDPNTLRKALNPEDGIGSSSGVGLANTDRRLKQLYGTGLKVKGAVGLGTIVSFTVPKEGRSGSLSNDHERSEMMV